MITLFGGNKNIELKWWSFPAGERGVKIVEPKDIEFIQNFKVTMDYESDQDFVDMLLLVNALRNVLSTVKLWANIPYFPYARQDRVMTEGEAFSLQVAVQLVSLCRFSHVRVTDAHSDVLAGMFEPGTLEVVPQYKVLGPIVNSTIDENLYTAIVSPDAGALKKIYKLAAVFGLPVIEAGKVRDVSTGNIVGVSINADEVAKYDELFICDDICDGGATFLSLADKIHSIDPTIRLHLVTTHGIYSKGLDVLKEKFYTVQCYNDMSKGEKNV